MAKHADYDTFLFDTLFIIIKIEFNNPWHHILYSFKLTLLLMPLYFYPELLSDIHRLII